MQTTGRVGGAQKRGNAELYDVEDPGPNDVLFGRGTGSNMHSGNIRFRALIQKYKPVYRDTPKKMKPSVSTKVVAIWRSQNPPGRFLTRSDRFHGSKRTFYDVGDAMARRKAAQCLREKSSKERLQQQQEKAEERRPLDDVDADTTNHEEDPNVVVSGTEEEFIPGLGASLSANCNDVGIPGVTTSMEPVQEEQVSQPESLQAKEMKDDIDMLAVVTSANLNDKFGPSSSTQTNVPPKEETADESATKLMLPTLKTLVQTAICKKQDEVGWLACGSPKSDSTGMSLVGAYESNLKEDELSAATEDRNGSSDSPFLFASFDFENSSNQADSTNNDEGGLCFPSLFGGGDSGKSSPNLFGDDDDHNNNSESFLGGGSSAAFPSLFGASSPNFPFEEPTESAPPLPPIVAPPALPKPNNKEDTLQNIRDRMPTAASLTTNLFDW